MADFTARYTAGVSLAEWSDPAGTAVYGSSPSRINPRPGLGLKRDQCAVGDTVEISATVGGVEGEVDGNLSGRLFTAWPIEWPVGGPPVFAHPAGQSSVQSFAPHDAGHYTFGLRRASGGAVFFHLDVRDP